MSIYYKYAPYWSQSVVHYYVYDCVYWYTYEEPEKWFVYTLGKRSHENFLRYVHWFISIRISQLKYTSISVDKDIYETAVMSKHIYIAKKRENS